MRPSTFAFILGSGFKNIRRNWMFSFASILTMAACIFLFGIFYSIVNNVSFLARKVEGEVPVTIFFEEGTTGDQMSEIGKLLEERPEVDRIDFESAQEAWNKMKETYFEDDPEVAKVFTENPLEGSSNYRVYLSDIEMQNVLITYASGLDHVREVRGSDQAASTLGNFNRVFSYISMAVIAILLIIAVFLISNTVSVGIAVRREEIGIMKYIGATDGLVRAPFVLEGIILGLIGAAIPLVILYFAYNRAIAYILTRFSVFAGSVQFIPVEQIYRFLIPLGLALGVGIGLVGSFVTTRKHLNV